MLAYAPAHLCHGPHRAAKRGSRPGAQAGPTAHESVADRRSTASPAAAGPAAHRASGLAGRAYLTKVTNSSTGIRSRGKRLMGASGSG